MEEVQPLGVKKDTKGIRRMVRPLPVVRLVRPADMHALPMLLVMEPLELLSLQQDW
jgi:hypothetical protein